jgi:hypothetical protein
MAQGSVSSEGGLEGVASPEIQGGHAAYPRVGRRRRRRHPAPVELLVAWLDLHPAVSA